MKRAAALVGVVIGLGAILLGWCARSRRDVAETPHATPGSHGPAAPSGSGPLRVLGVPVAGVAAGSLRDSFAEPRSGHRHEAIDIPAARGTRVIAADDGQVVRLLASARGGLTLYQFDPSATYCYYYAHLDGYAPGLREGQAVRRGDTLGYVGSTGNAPRHAPHLHFAVSRLGPEKRWSEGTAIDPYALLVRAD
jgi:murein DD-endopeptidase MepM/ murein hydrolase activator NlpD